MEAYVVGQIAGRDNELHAWKRKHVGPIPNHCRVVAVFRSCLRYVALFSENDEGVDGRVAVNITQSVADVIFALFTNVDYAVVLVCYKCMPGLTKDFMNHTPVRK